MPNVPQRVSDAGDMKRLPAVLFALFVTGTLAEVLRAAELINDRAIMVHTAREATEKRRALIQYLWGDAGFPTSSIPSTARSMRKASRAGSSLR